MSDEIVMAEVRSGRTRQLSVLFDRHHRSLFRYFYRVTSNIAVSEDLTQEAFLRMLRYRQSYLPGYSFQSWMYGIARNLQADHFHRSAAATAATEGWRIIQPSAADPEQSGDGLLEKAMHAIPASQRELLILARYQELPYTQIAELLGCEVGAVKTRVHRAVRALKEAYFSLSKRKAS